MRNLRLSITVIPITDEYDILATTLIETEVRQMMERVLPLVPVKTVANPLSCVSSSICLGPYVISTLPVLYRIPMLLIFINVFCTA